MCENQRQKNIRREMPIVTIRAVVDGREEILTEHLCDWPDCPRAAVEVIGFVRELKLATAYCAEHAVEIRKRSRS
jgi:hypothetical protein